jgi:hypothetical protein
MNVGDGDGRGTVGRFIIQLVVWLVWQSIAVGSSRTISKLIPLSHSHTATHILTKRSAKENYSFPLQISSSAERPATSTSALGFLINLRC